VSEKKFKELNKKPNIFMLENRSKIEKKKNKNVRIQIESLRYLRENNSKFFEEVKEELEGTPLWKLFQKEYG
jgi:hypothetical protein